MSHWQQQEYCRKIRDKFPEYFTNKRVLDIGSLDINGNNQFLFTDCDYFGLDVGEGPNVDVVSVGHIYDAPDATFDIIISTEVFEHDMFYEDTIKNVIRMLKPGGAFIFTCASTGRPEHGTRRSDGSDAAPLLIQISEEWSDYYKNLTEEDVRAIDGFNAAFPDGVFQYNPTPGDLYFFGVKGGMKETKKYISNPYPDVLDGAKYPDDIFVLGAWPNTEEKENDLLDCINRLRAFKDIPILLVSHYPIKSEIQKLVDYYIFDKSNDLLLHSEYSEYNLHDMRWTQMSDHRVENQMEYHHDYAIWVSMQHAFNFCKYLNKTQIHYMEYDNLIDTFQYRQAFLEKSKSHDAVLYEYHTNAAITLGLGSYCATYIFSAKTDLLLKMMNEVKSKQDYFMNRPTGWQLERVFLYYIKKHTDNFIITPYIDNDTKLNTQAVWNRDGIFRDGIAFQMYPCVDIHENIYLHLISGFDGQDHKGKDLLLEIRYDGVSKFEVLHKDEYKTVHLGNYKKGRTIRTFLFGKEVFSQFLGETAEEFRKMNELIWSNTNVESTAENNIEVHFVDGPFVEIKGNNSIRYDVKFIDADTDQIIYQVNLKNNEWARCSRKWFTNWRIEINSDRGKSYIHTFDPTDKKVFIVFESSSLGDTIAWIPYVEEFRKKNKCHVVVSTFMNDMFREQYPELEFVKTGTNVNNLYALYRLGCFYDDNKVDMDRHKTDFRSLRLQEYASDILGLDFEEILPRMPKISPMKSDKPYICIANHSTAQSKYWNNQTGWQELVDYAKSLGYDVYLLSREEDGYMGNKNPSGVIKVENKTLEEIGAIMLGSQGFVGISSGLSWLAWSLGVNTVLISGQTDKLLEPITKIERVINESVCHACFSRHLFDKGDWNWCPEHKGTQKQFECSKEISFDMVKSKLNDMLKI